MLAGDPTEGAMLVAAGKAGLDHASVAAAFPRAATIPFSSQRQYMATLHECRDPDAPMPLVALAKGAVEKILDLCAQQMAADGTLSPVDADAAHRAAGELAAAGMRVLATAMRWAAGAEEFAEGKAGGSESDLAPTMVSPGCRRCWILPACRFGSRSRCT